MTQLITDEDQPMQQLKELLAVRGISPANTPICRACKRQKRTDKNGFCWTCGVLERVKTYTWVTCPKCRKEWSKLREDGICSTCNEEREIEMRKVSERQKILSSIFGSVDNAIHYTFDNFDIVEGTETAFQKARNFNCERHNLYLWGGCGRGKTHLAYAVLIEHLKKDKSFAFVTPRELVSRFRFKKTEEELNELEHFSTIKLLIIDDVGVCKSTDHALEVIGDILNKRALKRRNGLIITSNLSLENLSKKNEDDRLPSRLAGMCEFAAITSKEDYRVKRQSAGMR
jgi:DNA replication protein DnaC